MSRIETGTEIAELAKLQRGLREGVAALVADAERTPATDHIYVYMQLVTACQRLERQAKELANQLLELQEPHGTS